MKLNQVCGVAILAAGLLLAMSSWSTHSIDWEASQLVGGADCGVVDHRTCDGKTPGDPDADCPSMVMYLVVGDTGNVGYKKMQSCGNHANCSHPRVFDLCVRTDPVF